MSHTEPVAFLFISSFIHLEVKHSAFSIFAQGLLGQLISSLGLTHMDLKGSKDSTTPSYRKHVSLPICLPLTKGRYFYLDIKPSKYWNSKEFLFVLVLYAPVNNFQSFLIETVLLGTHNISWLRNKKIIFSYALLSGGLNRGILYY